VALHEFDSGDRHDLLGKATVNVAIFNGGSKVNMVPDLASMELDVRTLPGQSEEGLLERFAALALPGVELSPYMSSAALWTEADEPFVQLVYDQLEAASGQRPRPAGISYFTDGSVLKAAMHNAPTVILGPGEPSQAHQTDEYCLTPRIGEAVDLYTRIGRAWLEA